MDKKQLWLVAGTRPEIIKMAPLYFACRKSTVLRPLFCLSGQHDGLAETALADFGLVPELRFPAETGSLAETTARLLRLFGEAISAHAPHGVAVHGDTATAFSAALAAFYEKVPVFHVEAGLRTGDLNAPFPEELYRVTVDRLARHCFAPTEAARRSLLREGRAEEDITVSGNTVVDALRYTVTKDFSHPYLGESKEKKLILLTCHRRESHALLPSLLWGIRRAIEDRDDVLLLFPVHPSPATREAAKATFGDCPNARLLPPLSALLFHNLLSRAHLLLTDSGGAEEEATALGIPTLVLREKTERPEGVTAGVLFPVGTEGERVKQALCQMLDTPPTVRPSSVYGDGHAAERIVRRVEKLLIG